MGDGDISADEYAACLRPREALTVVRPSFIDIGAAANTIIERLKGGLVRAVAKSSAWGEGGNPSGTVRIPASYWSHISGKSAQWWDSGDIRFFIPGRSGAHYKISSSTGRFYGVRFEPAGIDEIVRDLPPRSPPPSPAPPPPQESALTKYGYPTQTDEPERVASPSKETKSVVSESDLKAWWTFYSAVVPQREETEQGAMDHFARCFPTKSVTRQRIRALRPKQKPGPRPSTAE